MGGGGGGHPIGRGYWKNAMANTPSEALNWRLALCVLCFGLMGAARGLDEGLISGTISQISFQHEYSLTVNEAKTNANAVAQKTGNITAMVQIGSVAGALIAFLACDRIGRIWATRQLTLVWVVGVLIYITANGSYGQVLAGRFIMGLGIGQTTVVAPTYLAEVAPRSIRGLCVCIFSGSVYLGIMLGYFANWGTSLHIASSSAKQWIIPTTMHIMFAGIIFIATFFVVESPRYLCKEGDYEKAAMVMMKLRGLPVEHLYVQAELIDIKEQIEREQEATLGSSWLGPLRELFTMKSNLYRFMLGFMAQLLGQWSGGGSITIYAPQFFAILGTTGQSEKLFSTAIFGVVKFVSALICAFFLVDFLGRKRALSIGIILQFISVLYVAIFLTAVPQVTKINGKTGASIPLTGMAKHAGTGAIAFIYFSGVGWALGWNSIQYLIGAEIFPLRVRSLGTSLIMCFHFVNQYGSSKAVPLMLLPAALQPSGTFWFFTAVTLLGLAWTWFFLPETAGKSLESMDELFSLPWHLIGRKGANMTKGHGGVAEALENGGDAEKLAYLEVERLEHVENKAST